MSDHAGYAVFLFPPALEALGAAIRPYLVQAGSDGPQLLCRSLDISGAFAELELLGQAPDGRELRVELMLPAAMIRMVVSVQGDEHFGFVPRGAAQGTAGTATPAPAASGDAIPALETPALTPPALTPPAPAAGQGSGVS